MGDGVTNGFEWGWVLVFFPSGLVARLQFADYLFDADVF